MENSHSPRAARLMEEAQAAREALQNEIAAGAKSAPPKRAAKAGAASRDLNKRIRSVLREHIDSVYGDATTHREPLQHEDAGEALSLSDRIEAANREYSRDEFSSESTRFFANQPAREADAQLASRENLDAKESEAAREKSVAGSWESLADEIAPVGARPARGLATGTARRVRPQFATEKSSPLVWREEPLSPRAILGQAHAPDTNLHEALCGVENCDDTGNPHYLVARQAAHYDAAFANLGERMARVLAAQKFEKLGGAAPCDLLFVDIETTGLSSLLPLFLVGALEFSKSHEGTLHLFLARDYPEERSLLAAFHNLAAGKSLITFNGKSFDWPYIEGRSVSHRLKFQKPPQHFDLLHHARRQWKHQLPNCKLQTLELYLCGRNRIDDVAGSEIPRTYHEFVRAHAQNGCGAHLMGPILHHNALDILTMAELFCLAGEE